MAMSGVPLAALPSEAWTKASASGSCTTFVTPVGDVAVAAGQGAGGFAGTTCEAGDSRVRSPLAPPRCWIGRFGTIFGDRRQKVQARDLRRGQLRRDRVDGHQLQDVGPAVGLDRGEDRRLVGEGRARRRSDPCSVEVEVQVLILQHDDDAPALGGQGQPQLGVLRRRRHARGRYASPRQAPMRAPSVECIASQTPVAATTETVATATSPSHKGTDPPRRMGRVGWGCACSLLFFGPPGPLARSRASLPRRFWSVNHSGCADRGHHCLAAATP